MRFVEAKLGTPFPDLVETHILSPLDISDASFAYREENFTNVALSVDADTGEFRPDWGIIAPSSPTRVWKTVLTARHAI